MLYPWTIHDVDARGRPRDLHAARAPSSEPPTRDLRRQFTHLSVFLETNPLFASLPVATADTAQLIAAAHRALGAIWRDGYRYRNAGVVLIDLVKAASVGDGLFDRRDDPRSLARMRTLDALNARFGRDTVTYGRTAARKPWLLRSDMLSRRFTTDWDELLAV